MTKGVRTIAYHPPLASSFGDRFEATMTHRQMEVGFGSKRLHFTMRSSRLHRSSRSADTGNGDSILWRAMGYVGCASLALGLVFVSGSVLRASPPAAEYAVVMPIGDSAAVVAPRHKVKPRPIVRARLAAPVIPAPNLIDDWSADAATEVDKVGLGIARPDPDVATLPTVNGERAVAVYGPSRLIGGKSCRDVSVFVRGTDGKINVSPATQCGAPR